MKQSQRHSVTMGAVLGLAAWTSLIAAIATAQPPGPPGPPRSARESAPIELTGQWVAIVTEDWRFRMVTPPAGDFEGFQLTPAAAAIANAWDPAKDEAAGDQCKAYGAAGIMRVPGRIRISWQDDSTLKIETDAGRQTRLLHFGRVPDPSAPSLQGLSRAEWQPHGGGPGRPPVSGSLKVTTTHLTEGYVRKNGVPYSASTVLTEYLDVLAQPDGSQWLVVKSIVDDRAYHAAPPITSSNFRRETDRSGWEPEPCSAR